MLDSGQHKKTAASGCKSRKIVSKVRLFPKICNFFRISA